MNVTKSKEQRCAYLCPQVEVLEMEIEAMITTSPGAGAGGGGFNPGGGGTIGGGERINPPTPMPEKPDFLGDEEEEL